MRTIGRGFGGAMALVLVASSCIGGGGGGGAFVVSALTGAVEILVGQEAWRPLGMGERVASGSSVKVYEGATVAMTRGESALEIRTDRPVPAEVTITDPDEVEVASGDVLVTSAPGAAIEVASGGIRASAADAVFRFDRQLSLRIGVYEGTATVASPRGDLELPELREGVVAGRVLPRAVSPLRLDPADPWDARLLPDVIALDAELAVQKRGYQAEFGGRQRTVRPLEPVLRPLGFMRPYLAETPSGDLLIGLVLAALLDDGRGRVGPVFRQLMALYERGASWGLLAHEYGIAPAELTDAIVRAIGLRTGDVDQGTSITPEPDGTSEPDPTREPTGSKTDKPKPTRSPTPTGSPSPTDSPSPTESPSPTPSCFPGPPPLCT